MVAALESRGALERTILVFTSDNGYLFGEDRFSSEGLPFEEAIRVPLYVRYPAAESKRVEDALVINHDLAATVGDLAGIELPSMVDGRSIVPILGGVKPSPWRHHFLIQGSSYSRMGSKSPTCIALRTGTIEPGPSHLFVWWCEGEPGSILDYCDMNSDPFQLTSSPAWVDPNTTEWIVKRVKGLRCCAGEDCTRLERR